VPAKPAKFAKIRRIPAFLGRHAYLGVAAAALLIVTRTVDFSAPTEVRQVELPTKPAPPQPAPSASIRGEMGAEDAVQIRATLRLIEGAKDVAADANDEVEIGRILSQPVVATLAGVPATIDQTVRVDDGALELRIAIDVTPREHGRKNELTVEHRLEVTSRVDDRWGNRTEPRLHLRSESVLSDLERRHHRLVFAVEDRLFTLDLDAHRPS